MRSTWIRSYRYSFFWCFVEKLKRSVRITKDLTSAYEDVLTIHAEGSMAAQKLSIYVLPDFEKYQAAAKRVSITPHSRKAVITVLKG